MKTILFGLVLSLVASAQVMIDAEVQSVSKNFNISSFGDFGSRIYYNCDSVENAVESMMTDFGATNVSVRCTGGLNRWGGFPTEARVSLSMDVLKMKAAGAMRGEYKSVRIRSFRSCHLLKEIADKTHGLFDVKTLDYTRRCTSSDRFKLDGEFFQ